MRSRTRLAGMSLVVSLFALTCACGSGRPVHGQAKERGLPLARLGAVVGIGFPSGSVGWAVLVNNFGTFVIARSTDSGKAWRLVKSTDGTVNVWPPEIANNHLVGFCFPTPLRAIVAFSANGVGVASTTDGGRIWHESRLGPSNSTPREPTVSCPEPGVAFLSTAYPNGTTSRVALYVSGNAGRTWTVVGSEPASLVNATWGAVAFADQTDGWMGVQGGQFASTLLLQTSDGGRTFSPAAVPDTALPPTRWVIGPAIGSGNVAAVLVTSGAGVSAVFTTTDLGATWASSPTTRLLPGDSALAVAPNGAVWVTGVGPTPIDLYSAGLGWVRRSVPFLHAGDAPLDLAFDPEGTAYLVCTGSSGDYVLRSVNAGRTWTLVK